MTTYRYIPGCATVEDAELWAEGEGLVLVIAERGPDGRVRGLATDAESATADAAIRAGEVLDQARKLRETAEGMRP